MKNLLLLCFLSANLALHGQSLSLYNTVASYSLIERIDDVTGMHADAEVINSPFVDSNGVYCNGIYIHSGNPDGSLVRTPHLEALYDPAFAISVEFRTDSITTQRPVIVCGDSWRYLGILIRHDGIVMYNLNDTWYDIPEVSVQPDEWYRAVIIYTTVDSTAQYWLNGHLIASRKGVLNRPDNDGRVSNTDYGMGWTFQGYMRHLTVMSSEELLSGAKAVQTITRAHVYPNPADDILYVNTNGAFEWSIWDTQGMQLKSGGQVYPGIDISGIPDGTYFLQTWNETERVHVVRFLKQSGQ